MTPRLRNHFFFTIKMLIALCTVGLMAGCATVPTTPQAATTKTTTTITALPNQQPTTYNKSTQPLATEQLSINDHQNFDRLSTAARITQLKKDQLYAQAHTAVYSDHIMPTTTTTLPSTTPQAEAPDRATMQYTVDVGENLYSIAARSDIYNDGLLWPMIYKANRDQIKNPKQIFPGQQLIIQRQQSETEKEEARAIARESDIFLH